VLKLPDAARGKVAKCSGCGGRVRVPTGESEKPRKKRKRPAAPVDDGDPDADFLSGVDLRRAEDFDTPLCPKCAAEVDAEDIECPACGINLATGVLSEKQRYLRARKGPDTDLFYGKVWSDSWEFLLDHWRLVSKTFMIWTICSTMLFSALSIMGWCVGREVDRRTAEQEELQGKEDGKKEKRQTVWAAKYHWLFVILVEEQKKVAGDRLSPDEILDAAQKSPPVRFWGFIALILALTGIGWYWSAALHVITATMERKRLKKIPFDFFDNAYQGAKGYIWPSVLVLPFFWFPPAGLLPLLVFPIALVHMTQQHSYQAWLPMRMMRVFGRIPAPTLYVLMVAFVTHLVVLIAAVVVAVTVGPKLLELFVSNRDQLAEWLNTSVFGFEAGGFMHFVLAELPSVVVILLVVTIPASLCSAIPAVFTMRTIGLFGYYFRPELDLAVEHPANTPCGFWVRWLAYVIDCGVILFLALVVVGLVYLFLNLLAAFGMELESLPPILMGFHGLFYLLFPWLYFALSQSGLGQASLGKRALGVIVTDLNGEPITFRRATGRYFSKIISAIPLMAGFFMAAFTDKKQALHDRSAKTLVVWQSEEGRS